MKSNLCERDSEAKAEQSDGISLKASLCQAGHQSLFIDPFVACGSSVLARLHLAKTSASLRMTHRKGLAILQGCATLFFVGRGYGVNLKYICENPMLWIYDELYM